MVKSKKSKKVSKGEEVDSDSDGTKSMTDDGTFAKERGYSSSKMKESNVVEEVEHNVNDETKENARKAPKKKKQSKKLEVDDDDVVPVSIKTKKSDVSLEIGDGEDVTPNIQKQKKQKNHKSLFEMLEVEEPDHEDVDHYTDNEGGTNDSEFVMKTKKTKKKNEGCTVALKEKQHDIYSEENIKDRLSKGKKMDKGGKKNRKKRNDDDDEEEIERMLAELELEYKGEKPKKDDKLAVTETEQPMEKVEDKKKKSRKTKKGDQIDNKEVNDDHVEHDNEEKATKAPSQKKKGKKSEKQEKHFVEENDSKDASSEVQVAVESELRTYTKEEIEKDHEEDDGDAKEKKDKTKKKEKEERPKKGPGKKQVLLMQEALKKLKLEEEKRRLEEEAKMKAAEEAERLRLEKLQLEKERKEKKKQREKERKEKLKAEGKLLTKTQKQQRARATAMLEALKAQGFDVPSVGEKKERIVQRVNKVKKHVRDAQAKNTSQETTNASEVPTPVTENASSEDQILPTSVEVEEHINEDNEEGVKDAWDASSDSESEKEAVQFHNEKPAEDNIEDDTTSESDASSITSEESSDDEESESGSESGDSDSDDHKTAVQTLREKVIARIQKRREDAESNLSVDVLRSPIVCVLGHVDTGKTKILDKIRHTNVQDGEAGGITQQIGATMVPVDAIREQGKMVKNFASLEIKLPGLLIIDTPGHESFSNLRSRGSSLCDIAILVVDIMHGLEPQTIESINLLKLKKTPFIVALNKIDRLYDWKTTKNKDIRDVIKLQSRNTLLEFSQRAKDIIVQFAEQGFNAALFYENEDKRNYVSMVPTSASTGEGMGNLLALVVELMQTMLTKRLAFSEELQATVLELKAISGLGTTIDVILVNGRLREGDTMVLAGMDGPIVTQIRSLLMPQPLKELRVKTPYQEFKEVKAAQGVKITAKDLDKVIAGLNLVVAHHPDEIEYLKEEVVKEFHAVMNSIKLAERGVYVQASTLGSLEALLEFLRASKIPFSGIRIGPVVRRDVMKTSIMLEHDSQYAVILAFDVKIERDAQELADSLGVRIFSADIIYHLFDRFTEFQEKLKKEKRDEFKNIAVFPCKLRILPQFIFNSRDPIVVGVSVEAGVVKEGTPLCVPSKEFLEIGIVTTIEINHKTIESARKGQEVCIKVEPIPGESPKMFGRHFDHTDMLTSKISRQSIDACKDYFRDDLTKADWQLMIELKKLFHIL